MHCLGKILLAFALLSFLEVKGTSNRLSLYRFGEGNSNPLQYSCLENPMDREAWWTAVQSQRVGHDWAASLSLFTFMHWRRKWQPTPVFLPGESQGWGSLLGCRLWGRTEADTTYQHIDLLFRSYFWAVFTDSWVFVKDTGYHNRAIFKYSVYQYLPPTLSMCLICELLYVIFKNQII